MEIILQAIIPLFLLIAIGILAKFVIEHKKVGLIFSLRKKRMSADIWSTVLNKFALYLALPTLILHSLFSTNKEELLSPTVILANILFLIAYVLLIFGILKITKFKTELTNTYFFCSFFGNVGYIGFPFILALIPNSGNDISILIAIHSLIAFTLGLFILEKSKQKHHCFSCLLKTIFFNPLLLAVFIGFFFLFLPIKIPEFILETLRLLGASASPVILISIGLFMAKKIVFNHEFVHGAIIAAIKILVMPALFIVSVFLFNLKGAFTTSILEMAMPVGLTNFALAQLYPMNKRIVGNAIIISTIVSLITLTLLSFFLI